MFNPAEGFLDEVRRDAKTRTEHHPCRLQLAVCRVVPSVVQCCAVLWCSSAASTPYLTNPLAAPLAPLAPPSGEDPHGALRRAHSARADP